MITLYGFGKVHPLVHGETRDLRVQWALEEAGLPYRVHGIDHTGGEHLKSPYTEISDFRLVPAIDDEGFILTESGAIVLYIAEKSKKLIPSDLQGRMHVTQWCFSALNTVERPMLELLMLDKFGGDKARREQLVKEAQRWFTVLERRLQNREWIMGSEFTAADILINGVLREIRHTDLLKDFPNVKGYYERAMARPAWTKTLKMYSERLGANFDNIM